MAKVLVYKDAGVLDASHASVSRTLRELCRDTHDVQTVSSQVLALAPWDTSTPVSYTHLTLPTKA